MKAVPYCLPEVLDTVIATACKVSSDHFIHEKVLDRVLSTLAGKLGYGSSAESLLYYALETTYHALGVKDPYAEVKSGLNHSAVAVKKRILGDKSEAFRSLTAFMCYSLAASDKDVIARPVVELEKYLRDSLSAELEFEASRRLQQQILGAKSILFVSANSGELVIDSMLVNALAENAKVSLAVAAKPVALRAMREDAKIAGISEGVDIIDPGSGMLGVSLEKASSEFREVFTGAELVIAKGGVNFETLRGCGREVFYLMYCDEQQQQQVQSTAPKVKGRERRVLFSTDGKDKE